MLAELLKHSLEFLRSLVAQVLILLLSEDIENLLLLVTKLLGVLSLLGLLQLGVDDMLDDLDLGRQNLILRRTGIQKALLLRLLFLRLERLENAVQLLDGQIPEILRGDDTLLKM